MQKTAIFSLVIFAILLTACQPQVQAPATLASATQPVATVTLLTATPTKQPTPTTDALTPTPTQEPTLPPTETPAAAAALPPAPCLAVQGYPFTFYQDNDHILSRTDTKVYITDLKTSQVSEFLALTLPEGVMIQASVLSPNGDRLAFSLTDFTIQVYQTADKKLLHTLTGHFDMITKLAYSPDGEILYSGSHDKTVHAWDRAGKDIGAFQATGADNFPSGVMGLGVSPDGKLLATIPSDGKTRLWDAQKFTFVRELGANGGYDNGRAIFSPDGQYLAAITVNGLFLWRVADGKELMGGNPGINAMALAYSPDGSYLIYWDVSNPGQITFRSPEGSQDLGSLPTGDMPVWDIFFSADGAMLVTASDIETHVWHVSDGVLVSVIKPQCP